MWKTILGAITAAVNLAALIVKMVTARRKQAKELPEAWETEDGVTRSESAKELADKAAEEKFSE